MLIPLEEKDLWEIKERIEAESVESIAVALLHTYAFPQHELAVGGFLREQFPRIPISLSHQVLPERKEYERTATTVVNAYVRPTMEGYLQALRDGLRQQKIDAPLLIMQSAGGLTPEEDAALRPVFMLESGPAAGVLAAAFLGDRLGTANLITLDMGGTTAKSAMIEGGRVDYSSEYEVGSSLSVGNRLVGGGGELIRAPSIDIGEVGAGGGSIAYLDPAGGLRVGPQSAAALQEIRAEMARGMLRQFGHEGFESKEVKLQCHCDVRFKGQTSEIRLEILEEQIDESAVARLCFAFQDEHQKLYGHGSDPGNPIEVVAVRLIGRAGAPPGDQVLKPAPYPEAAGLIREACFSGEVVDTPVLARTQLTEPRQGPLLIDEYDSTIVVPSDATAQVDEEGNVVMELANV